MSDQVKYFLTHLTEDEATALRRVGLHPGEYDTASAVYRADMTCLECVIARILEDYDLLGRFDTSHKPQK
jgi:hypothetical protein